MYKGYYNDNRLKFIHSELINSGEIVKTGESIIRKTGTFFGPDLNFYIDTSDGVNEDIGINEYCGRILQIIADCHGKPFLMFKTSFSEEKTSEIIDIARKNNGDVVPFFIFSYHLNFYDIFLNNKEKYIEENKNTVKEHDIGFYANLGNYYYPKPDIKCPNVSCEDFKHFGFGSGQNTGYFEIKTRSNLYVKLINSRFDFAHKDKVDYESFLHDSCKWKVCLAPPGCGEYSSRILEHSALGQCVVLRKASYDNAISWNEYFPQIDFEAENWEDELQKIVDNYQYWGQRAKEYYDSVYQPKLMVKYIFDEIDKFKKKKGI
jgi:hypothetical protein